jgi:hypothetical protein
MKVVRWFKITILFVLPLITAAQTEKVDQDVMNKIRQEGLQNSKVMDIAFHLTDASGPRVTASPGFMRAASYAKQQLSQWGLVNDTIEAWGDFGKGWELQKSYVAITSPWYKSLSAYPKVWTSGTNGLTHADVLLVTAKDSGGVAAYKGKLANKVIIVERADTYKQSFKPDAARYTDGYLDTMAQYKIPPPDTSHHVSQPQVSPSGIQQNMMPALKSLASSEGAVAILSSIPLNHDGTIFVQQAGPYKVTDPANFLDIGIGWEDYQLIVRLLKNNVPVSMDIDVASKFYTADTKAYNVLGEIKGTDKNLKDELVMLGGHLDSWHSGTGATDNAAGCAVMMEAVRILKAIGVKPRRTICIALWSGEEQGLLGSEAYVKKTFGDPETMKLLPAHQKFSSYFNVDNGSGKIRGIYLQGNEAAGKIFSHWFEPFNDLGAKTLTLMNTGGTDHLSFDAVGLPGFQFIQDPLEYGTRTHHSNMDVYDHLIEDDLKQAATIVAAFVYNSAMRDQ